MKNSIIFLATMLIWTMSSCVSADKRQVSNMNGIDNQLIGDGNVTWVLDKATDPKFYAYIRYFPENKNGVMYDKKIIY